MLSNVNAVALSVFAAAACANLSATDPATGHIAAHEAARALGIDSYNIESDDSVIIVSALDATGSEVAVVTAERDRTQVIVGYDGSLLEINCEGEDTVVIDPVLGTSNSIEGERSDALTVAGAVIADPSLAETFAGLPEGAVAFWDSGTCFELTIQCAAGDLLACIRVASGSSRDLPRS